MLSFNGCVATNILLFIIHTSIIFFNRCIYHKYGNINHYIN